MVPKENGPVLSGPWSQANDANKHLTILVPDMLHPNLTPTTVAELVDHADLQALC